MGILANWWLGMCDSLIVNHQHTANIELTLREFKVQWFVYAKISCRLLTCLTSECVGLSLCNVRLLYSYFHANVQWQAKPEVLHVYVYVHCHVQWQINFRAVTMSFQVVRLSGVGDAYWRLQPELVYRSYSEAHA